MATKKVAFLFMVYDTIAHEATWNDFFAQADPAKYAIHIHYKTQIPSRYFEKCKLDHCVPTAYGDISLVIAQNLLLTAALQDPDVYKMVLLSNTCIPLKSFDYVYDQLTRDNNGYFNVAPQSQCFPTYEQVAKYVPRDEIYKSSQWFIANRTQATMYTTHTEYIEYLTSSDKRRKICPEECYYITINKKFCSEDTVYTYNEAVAATTFTNWKGMDYKYSSHRGLKNYRTITADELDYLLTAPCLFGRKFIKGCLVTDSIATGATGATEANGAKGAKVVRGAKVVTHLYKPKGVTLSDYLSNKRGKGGKGS